MVVQVVEVSPRDGLQNEPEILSTASKIELIRRCVEAGARRVEAVSFVRADRVPQMADAEAVMAAVPRRSDVSYIGLVLNRRGLDRALAAGVDEVNCVVVATETFSQRNQGASVDAMLGAWTDIAKAAHAAGVRASVTVAAAFGCPFEGDVSAATVGDLARRLVEGEPDEIALADTIGVGVPAQVRALVSAVTAAAPGVPLRAHFHDTRNTAIANALAAVEAGVTVLDASVGGIGGCPFAPAATGNVATEDLTYALHRSGHPTGLDPTKVIETAAWIGDQLGKDRLPGALGRAGWFPTDPQ
ncbi:MULTISPECIES: hydroxymethylglutaryl-CoA lyase [unclassified Micromonospora]|jgi:hydroxymethylglutaryl-CoA lyase|uniref:hydroxymethylglutaryl-CoA lyase n=1 Tax=unclassified Micromonospora TaxID=2617518 RepID=UPI001033B613|nr:MULTISPECIES: hydroxymethylglutaryl-CoA lyase [unclassified Micromonospora]QKW13527.1 hydroxymethylglutaryl-CoA lyase [Verrucosispora sp. NA02020]TBL39284.1 hydroxymethylglutaryl-CoA lyase [Verrucosispora sp. SN26_14.1]